MPENIKKLLKEYKDETKRHFDVVAERLEDKISVIAEQVADNTEQISAIHEDVKTIKKDLGEVKDNVGVIKMDIEVIKNDLKQKVSRDEFVILEKRVSLLEARRK